MSIANTNAQSVVLSARSIGKYFYTPEKLKVLKDVQFDAYKGEFLTLVGKSGSGKSTLLYCLSTMDTDYEGDLFIDGERITGKHPTQLAAIRNQSIGFVFQFHYLLPEFSCLKNAMNQRGIWTAKTPKSYLIFLSNWHKTMRKPLLPLRTIRILQRPVIAP